MSMSTSTSTNPWTWSQEYQDYYSITYDKYRRPIYHWSKQTQASSESWPARHDSGQSSEAVAQMPDPAPPNARTLRGFIAGTPHTGWYDLLDSSYRIRTGSEALDFFVVGRVFAMLYTETAGNSSSKLDNNAYTVVRFNEWAHASIRRFVVIQVKRGFVYACGIGAYSGRGVLREGCNPSEHAIVYLSGTDPASCYLPGEWEKGMTKTPIEIIPVDMSVTLRRESRIRFSKKYPIEMNVKVKDIGRIHPRDISVILQYYNEEDKEFFGGTQAATIQSGQEILKSSPTPELDSDNDDVAQLRRDVQHHLSADRLNYWLDGELYSDFEIVNNTRSFFKKGLVFLVPWPEPSGSFVKDQMGPPVILKIRSGKATTKSGVAAQDHAAIVQEHSEVHYLPQEGELAKAPLFIRVEKASTGPIDPTSRVNFAKIYTVEYNVKVCKVGRLIPESIWHMDQYFAECTKIGTS